MLEQAFEEEEGPKQMQEVGHFQEEELKEQEEEKDEAKVVEGMEFGDLGKQ